MLIENAAPASRPPCDHCGGKTVLMRREPHPRHGEAMELHTFECLQCGKLTYRDDPPG